MIPRGNSTSRSTPLLCSSRSETPQKPFPSGTCAGFGWRGGCPGGRCGSCQAAEKHSHCAGPPKPSAPAKKKTQRALARHWRRHLLRCLFQMLQPYLFSDKKEEYGPISTLFLKCWISKSIDYDSEQQKHSNAERVLAECTQSLLLYILDPVRERTLGQHIKANNNYYQINAV